MGDCERAPVLTSHRLRLSWARTRVAHCQRIFDFMCDAGLLFRDEVAAASHQCASAVNAHVRQPGAAEDLASPSAWAVFLAQAQVARRPEGWYVDTAAAQAEWDTRTLHAHLAQALKGEKFADEDELQRAPQTRGGPSLPARSARRRLRVDALGNDAALRRKVRMLHRLLLEGGEQEGLPVPILDLKLPEIRTFASSSYVARVRHDAAVVKRWAARADARTKARRERPLPGAHFAEHAVSSSWGESDTDSSELTDVGVEDADSASSAGGSVCSPEESSTSADEGCGCEWERSASGLAVTDDEPTPAAAVEAEEAVSFGADGVALASACKVAGEGVVADASANEVADEVADEDADEVAAELEAALLAAADANEGSPRASQPAASEARRGAEPRSEPAVSARPPQKVRRDARGARGVGDRALTVSTRPLPNADVPSAHVPSAPVHVHSGVHMFARRCARIRTRTHLVSACLSRPGRRSQKAARRHQRRCVDCSAGAQERNHEGEGGASRGTRSCKAAARESGAPEVGGTRGSGACTKGGSARREGGPNAATGEAKGEAQRDVDSACQSTPVAGCQARGTKVHDRTEPHQIRLRGSGRVRRATHRPRCTDCQKSGRVARGARAAARCWGCQAHPAPDRCGHSKTMWGASASCQMLKLCALGVLTRRAQPALHRACIGRQPALRGTARTARVLSSCAQIALNERGRALARPHWAQECERESPIGSWRGSQG